METDRAPPWMRLGPTLPLAAPACTWNAARVTPAADRFPDTHLTLCLTHDCNLRCRYCYGGAKSKRHMTLAVGRAALDRAVARTSERLHLVYFGGEPLLRWRTLVALTERAAELATAASLELRPTVTTNGTLLTDERTAWLRERRFVLAISCDGTKEAHDANRRDARGRSSHARTVAGLRRALDAGLGLRVILVLHPDNVDLLPDSLAFLHDLGAGDFVVNPDWSADWQDEPLQARWEHAYEAAARLWTDAHRAGRPFWLSFVDDKIAAAVKGGYTPAERCDLGRRNLVVAPSGRLYPCDRLVGEDREVRAETQRRREKGNRVGRTAVTRADEGGFAIGDVRSGPDPTLVAALVARTCGMPADCLECAIAPRCRNRCACANLALTGDPGVPSATLCFHEQLAVRVADAAAETLAAERNESFLRRLGPPNMCRPARSRTPTGLTAS
ncbi:MAG: radical SAM protein [Deltaproteobacteria bacterium]|nr:radical SAM protein [Deltaproteobacteria bacterium]